MPFAQVLQNLQQAHCVATSWRGPQSSWSRVLFAQVKQNAYKLKASPGFETKYKTLSFAFFKTSVPGTTSALHIL